ncbi:tetratricopeptide repeat protein [Candidatus Riflebacteria bacterium]
MSYSSDRQFEEALHLLELGALDRVVECLKTVLSEEPEHEEAHAVLAICLLNLRRIYAAEHEAQIALSLNPGNFLAHLALAHIFVAKREFSSAEKSLKHLIQLNPSSSEIYLLQAEVYRFTARVEESFSLLEKALELEPDAPECHCAMGNYFLSDGELEKAEKFAKQALELQPEHQHSLVLMGHCYLKQGKIEEAQEHAIWALAGNPTDQGSLGLLCAIKARTNPFTGLWWRFNTWLNELGETRSIFVLLFAFTIYRIAEIACRQFNNKPLSELVTLAWFCICIYTWLGPAMFQQALQKEMGQVALDDNF